MRLAIITDVHADVHALVDALHHIDAMGCDAIVCAGDCVDYGLFPNETLALLAERKIATVRGNHDRWAFDRDCRSGSAPDLSTASRRFLRATVRSWSLEYDGTRVEVWHARPGSDIDGIVPPPRPGIRCSSTCRGRNSMPARSCAARTCASSATPTKRSRSASAAGSSRTLARCFAIPLQARITRPRPGRSAYSSCPHGHGGCSGPAMAARSTS